jgi:hypothetical protein
MDYEDRQLLLGPISRIQHLDSRSAWTQTNHPAILKEASDNATRKKQVVRRIESYISRNNANNVPKLSEPQHDPPPTNDDNSSNESQMPTQNAHQDRQ